MTILEAFQKETDNQNTQYFIFDTKGGGKHGDIDFEKYEWSPSRYNLVRLGDLFIYRRPAKNSETKEFYFFGACKIGEITGKERYSATFSKRYPFQKIISQSDLKDFKWHWKEKGNSWEHFFNQYGMNKIFREDFINLLKLSENQAIEFEIINPEDEVEAIQDIRKENYAVEDRLSQAKIRAKQKVFSDKVKLNYNFTCAVCGIRTKEFLIGSHIVPWSKNKEIRLDPSNGICLCPLHDRAFEAGYLTLNDSCLIEISSAVDVDKELKQQLEVYRDKRIKLPNVQRPSKDYLKYHREIIFKHGKG